MIIIDIPLNIDNIDNIANIDTINNRPLQPKNKGKNQRRDVKNIVLQVVLFFKRKFMLNLVQIESW